MDAVTHILQEAMQLLESFQTLKEVEQIRVDYLGKKGKLTGLLKNLGQLSPEERPKAGEALNLAKNALQEALLQKKEQLEALQLESQLTKDTIDVTLPARGMNLGSLHPVTQTIERITQWFLDLDFEWIEGPEIEDDYHNFEALNIPAHHPARNMHDTFYFKNDYLLRTHTSPVQIRTMKNNKPPLRIITPGKVYRYDFDATHTPQFHQVEVLMVDKNINFSHLKSLLHHFLQDFFEEEVKVRFRPSYFPFTEPSVEIDIMRSDKQWLEVLGGGLVHPKVLQNCNIDSEIYTGLAFGLGVERLAMLYYGIPDIRLLFDNDLRFLTQF